MIRFHFTFNKEKMCKWLNEMAQQGWLLTGFGAGICRFKQGKPGSVVYQMDTISAPGILGSDYRELMADLGIEIVCRWGPWILLSRPADGKPFVLYTDTESRIAYLKRTRQFFKIMALLEIICFMMLLVITTSPASPALQTTTGIGACIALCAGVAMALRAAALGNEIAVCSGTDPLSLRPKRLIVTGLCVLLGGLLLNTGFWRSFGEFCCGSGAALVITGAIFLIGDRTQWREGD